MSVESKPTLSELLLGMIAEDYAIAQALKKQGSPSIGLGGIGIDVAQRLLDECEAKRKIVAEHTSKDDPEYCPRCVADEESDVGGWTPHMVRLSIEAPCPTVRHLALPYADRFHPWHEVVS